MLNYEPRPSTETDFSEHFGDSFMFDFSRYSTNQSVYIGTKPLQPRSTVHQATQTSEDEPNLTDMLQEILSPTKFSEPSTKAS